MVTNRPIQARYLFITTYILLALEGTLRIYFTKSTNAVLYYEMSIGAILLMIQFTLIQIKSVKKNAETQEELDLLSQRIPCGVAKLLVNDDLTLLCANEAFHRIIGYDSSEITQIMEQKIALLLHPADRLQIVSILKAQANELSDINIEYRIINKAGHVRWIHLDAFLSEAASEVPVYQCIFTDISDFQNALQQSELEKERYRILTELSDDILFEYDIKSHTLTASQAFVDLYGRDPQIKEFRTTMLESNTIHHADYHAFECLCDGMDAGEEKIEQELRFRLSGNRFIWYQIQGTVLTDKRGEPQKMIGKAVNIDAQKAENEALTKKSQLDPLTGVYNKVVTGQLIDEYLQLQCAGEKKLSALFIIDIDNFKGINDNQGHLFGDAVLTDISGKIKNTLRNSDIVGRIGGDEFVVFLKDIKRKEVAVHKAEELRSIFRNAFTGENKDYKISGSIGIALFPDDGRTYEELFRNADRSLYTAKNGGKDRFEFSGGTDDIHHRFSQSGIMSDFDTNSQIPKRIKFDEMLLKHIFELMNQEQKNDNFLCRILELIGDYYQANNTYIIEFADHAKQISSMSVWCEDDQLSCVEHLTNLSPDDWELHIRQFSGDGIYLSNRTEQDSSVAYLGLNSAASIQCAIMNQGQLLGIAALEDRNKDRVWTNYQMSTLSFFSKIIGYHFMHLRSQKQLKSISTRDALTGILNFEAFHAEAEALLRSRQDSGSAMVTCDIEQFKDINDAIGHDGGDGVIIRLSEIIRADLGSDECVGRVSADIFTSLLSYRDQTELSERTRRWNALFQEYISTLDYSNDVFITAGIYAIQAGEYDIPPMIDKANAARKLVKGVRNNAVRFYDDTLHAKLMHEKELATSMLCSLKNEDYVIYLQPKIRLSDGRIGGAEALVRWEHPSKGFLMPSDFIPLFERNRFIIDLDFYVLEHVCALLRRWLDQKVAVVPISVNFSRIHLIMPDFISKVIKIVNFYELPFDLIEIELTESAFINRQTDIQKTVHALKELGFTVSMDDFGCGYSSLNALKDIPIDVIKLDKGFFQSETATFKDEIIIRGFVEMTKKMNLRVVAEGIETEHQANFLRDIACDMAQGYFFARPVPVAQFEVLLQDYPL